MNLRIRASLKRSHCVVGLAKASRGLVRDIRVLGWLLKRRGQILSYLKTSEVKKLQLGTSNNALNGWLNTDIMCNNRNVVYMNATHRFPFSDNQFDYIMAEHMIEHVEYQAGQMMLHECLRILKPGGCLRLSTPDLRILLGLHAKEETAEQKSYIDWTIQRLMPEVRECKATFVINNAFRAWGHCFLYDQETLHHALLSSGFREIRFYKPGVSEDPVLRNLESHGKEIGDESINQFETIVMEARK